MSYGQPVEAEHRNASAKFLEATSRRRICAQQPGLQLAMLLLPPILEVLSPQPLGNRVERNFDSTVISAMSGETSHSHGAPFHFGATPFARRSAEAEGLVAAAISFA